jgi:hypothetical protein
MSTKIPLSCPPDKGKMRSIMRIIIEEPILSLPIPFIEKGILSLAKSFTDNGSRLYLSDEELSKPLFTHRMTVNRAIQNLVKLGYLEKRVESREGGKSYRSLKYLGVEHSNKLHLCLDGDDESIATNCISDSNKLHLCSPSIATNCITHSNKLHHITERNLKDHNLKVTESIVADAPLPTETELKDSLTNLEPVKEPLETLAGPESSGVTQPPRDFAPPLPKKKKAPSRNTSFPSPEYWASVKPNLLTWMRQHGAEGSDEVLLPWIDERLEKLEGAALSKNLKFAAWDRTFMTWYRHLIPDKYKRGFDWFVRNAVDQPRFLEVWKKKKDLEAFGYSDEAIEGYRKTLLNFDEDSPWGGSKIKHFRKTVQKGA